MQLTRCRCGSTPGWELELFFFPNQLLVTFLPLHCYSPPWDNRSNRFLDHLQLVTCGRRRRRCCSAPPTPPPPPSPLPPGRACLPRRPPGRGRCGSPLICFVEKGLELEEKIKKKASFQLARSSRLWIEPLKSRWTSCRKIFIDYCWIISFSFTGERVVVTYLSASTLTNYNERRELTGFPGISGSL